VNIVFIKKLFEPHLSLMLPIDISGKCGLNHCPSFVVCVCVW